jgi:hypothetical protein
MPSRKSVPKSQSAAGTKVKSKAAERQKSQSTLRTNSKQVKVIGMLSQPMGSTIPAIMKATGWQQHSVRGFFAGVIRKKLKLTLESEKPDDRDRTYRIIGIKPRKTAPKDGQSNYPVG